MPLYKSALVANCPKNPFTVQLVLFPKAQTCFEESLGYKKPPEATVIAEMRLHIQSDVISPW